MIAYKVVRGNLGAWCDPAYVYEPGAVLESDTLLYFYRTVEEVRTGAWWRRVTPERVIVEAELDDPETITHPQTGEDYLVAHRCKVLRIVSRDGDQSRYFPAGHSAQPGGNFR